jgi:hypothetical protein
MVNSLDTSTEASEESDDGGQERGENTGSETSKERSESNNEAGEEARNETEDEGEDLGEDLEDGVEDRDELGLETGDSDDGLDSSEDHVDEDGNEVEDLLDVAVSDGEASRTGKLGNDVGKLGVETLKAGDGQLGTLGLGQVTSGDLVGDTLEARGLVLDAIGTGLEDGEEPSDIRNVTLDDRLSALGSPGDDRAAAKDPPEELVEVENTGLDLGGGGRSVGSLGDRRSDGGSGQGEDGEESGLHFE